MISYDSFWKTLEQKGVTQYKLIFHYGISTSLIHRLKNNLHTTTNTLEKLCEILDCNINDIVNYVPNVKTHTLEDSEHVLEMVADSMEYRTKKG